MKFILILWMYGTPMMGTAEFDSYKACVSAADQVRAKRGGYVEYVCVRKFE